MAYFSGESLETRSGTITAWLPIPTPWLSIAACSSQIYEQLDGNLIAFDPFYGESISPSAIPCLPTEVTSSWWQSNSATTTVLGPTFVCPGAYTALQTLLVNSLTQQVLCCPSYVSSQNTITAIAYLQNTFHKLTKCRNYGLYIEITGKANFPTQCTSHLSAGQTLTFDTTSISGTWAAATSVVPQATAVSAGATLVWGLHVNGFNVLDAVTSNTPSSGATKSTTSTTSTTVTSSPSQTPSKATHSSSLARGGVAGVAIGGALLIALGAWLLWRYRKSRLNKQIGTPAMEGFRGPYEIESLRPLSNKPARFETVHEMDSSYNGER